MSENTNIAKTYDPKQVEDRLYKQWMEKNYFHAHVDYNKKPFTMVIPPPNITGQLHMGHALNNTMQDILIRWKRMQGYASLWLPGTDHASIATEAKIVEAMAAEGLTKAMIGREEFLKRAWEWKKHYGGRIVEQLKKLGSSCDWERERFTMDQGLSKAVTEVFLRLHKKGLIYRGERIINWCPKCNTSVSDIEVEYDERQGSFWHIKYPIKGSDEFLIVATTRPETMLGDTAVAVHPKDERYANLVGKMVLLPLINREIPIIADEYVEKEFGTGVVKITPAHDPNDFEVGLRHRLPQINVMNNNATMNNNAGKYEGLDRYEARKKVVEDLKTLGLLVKIEDHTHNVGGCQRCSTTVEPMLSKQWFVKMEPLAGPALDVVRDGTIKFIPDRFSKIYYNWMENIQDWCISRQLWWGHRIPAFYCQSCGYTAVAEEMPDRCPDCKNTEFVQDPDTLDTWFSSALWPFSTLGWPEESEDLKFFYPTNVLVTAYDIIFFWVARMIFSGMEQMGEAPFSHVMIHGLVRDAQGKKMSKTLGNGIEPLEIIDQYGTDALRFALTLGISPGSDLRFSTEKIEAGRNFANKIWNASRFVLMNFDDEFIAKAEALEGLIPEQKKLTIADKWILSRLNTLTLEVTDNMERFESGLALQKVYEFIWEEFCDWYIELVKPRLYNKDDESRTTALYVLNYVLQNAMKLLHPFMPFISEEIYQHLIKDSDSIMISSWPIYSEILSFKDDEKSMSLIMDAIKAIRNIRAEMNVPPSKRAKMIMVSDADSVRDILTKGSAFFEKLAGASQVEVQSDNEGIPADAVAAVVSGAEIFIPLEDLIDIEKEIERLQKEQENLKKELDRVNGKLSNEGFVAKAPEKVIEEERAKLIKYADMMQKVSERIAALKK